MKYSAVNIFLVYAILYTVRDGVPHGLNGGYIYINIYQLSAWPNIGIVALCKSKIPADIMGPGVQSILSPQHH